MLTKRQVLEMIESLQDTFPAEPLIDRIILLQKIVQGEEDIKAVKGLLTTEVDSVWENGYKPIKSS